jgi:hypothetical protein
VGGGAGVKNAPSGRGHHPQFLPPTWESFAERKIREAQESGAFDRLPGLGQPIEGIDEPLDENWWVRKKLKSEQLSLLPPVLEVRLEIEKFLANLAMIPNEYDVRRRVTKLNEKIETARRSPHAGPPLSVVPLDVDAVVERWRNERGGGQ